MKTKISTEVCCLCGDLTGKMGKDDDSIYVTPVKDDKFDDFKKGFELGPLCEDCYNELVNDNYFNPEEGYYPNQRPIYEK